MEMMQKITLDSLPTGIIRCKSLMHCQKWNTLLCLQYHCSLDYGDIGMATAWPQVPLT